MGTLPQQLSIVWVMCGADKNTCFSLKKEVWSSYVHKFELFKKYQKSYSAEEEEDKDRAKICTCSCGKRLKSKFKNWAQFINPSISIEWGVDEIQLSDLISTFLNVLGRGSIIPLGRLSLSPFVGPS